MDIRTNILQYKEKCQTLRRRAENTLLMRLFMYRSERSRKKPLLILEGC